MKRWLAVFLAAMMVIVTFAACGNQESTEGETVKKTEAAKDTAEKEMSESDSVKVTEPEAQTWDEDEVAEIKWTFWGLNMAPNEEDLQEVEAAINAITVPKIGVSVDMEVTDVGTYMTQTAMKITSGETIDLFTTFVLGSASYGTLMTNNQLTDITDLLVEYAPETMAMLPEQVAHAGTKDGRIYSLPLYTNYVTKNVWVCQKEVFDGIGLKAEEIKTLDDIHEALIKIKEAYPDRIPLGGNGFVYPGGQMAEITTGQNFQAIGYAAGLRYGSEGVSSEVVSRFETENFKALTEILKAWNNEGLVDKDMAMNASNMWYYNPKIVSSFESQSSLEMQSLETSAGMDYEFVELSENYVTNTPMLMLTSAVPVTAKEPAAAIRFLNLLYTDAEIKNLASFGIEGKHWEKKADGRIGFPEGVDETTSGYYLGSERLFGNVFLNYVWDTMDADTIEKEKTDMDHAKYAPFGSFNMNTDSVSNEVAQISAVYDEYFNTLMGGNGSETTYDEFITKLHASGLDVFMAEAQKQLDAWLAQDGNQEAVDQWAAD